MWEPCWNPSSYIKEELKILNYSSFCLYKFAIHLIYFNSNAIDINSLIMNSNICIIIQRNSPDLSNWRKERNFCASTKNCRVFIEKYLLLFYACALREKFHIHFFVFFATWNYCLVFSFIIVVVFICFFLYFYSM